MPTQTSDTPRIFRHYDSGNGLEYCSGREGWTRRKTADLSLVTCQNCLRQLARKNDR